MKKTNRIRLSESPKANRNLVLAETAITAGLFSVPIMSSFYESELGMNSFLIALSQICFTVVAMLLNAPLGLVADKFGRKMANFTGDFICALSLILYSQANSFLDVVACESLFGVGAAFTQGVDSTLLQHFCKKIDPSDKYFAKISGIGSMINQISCLAILLIGMPLTGNFRLCIAASSITYWIGAAISLAINDDSLKFIEEEKEEAAEDEEEEEKESFWESLKKIALGIYKNPELNVRVAAYIVTREITHPIIWVYPLLLEDIGMAVTTFSLFWCVNELFSFLGAFFGQYANAKIKEWQRFIIPVIAIAVASMIIFICPNKVTIWFYVLFAAVKGWTSATMMIPIKLHSDAKISTTIESIVRAVDQSVYILSSIVVGLAALMGNRYGFLATVLFFVPIAIPVVLRLRKQVNHEESMKNK